MWRERVFVLYGSRGSGAGLGLPPFKIQAINLNRRSRRAHRIPRAADGDGRISRTRTRTLGEGGQAGGGR